MFFSSLILKSNWTSFLGLRETNNMNKSSSCSTYHYSVAQWVGESNWNTSKYSSHSEAIREYI